MVLDEPKDKDQAYQVEQIDFLMSPTTAHTLDRYMSDVFIDYADNASGKGFIVRLKTRQEEQN